MLRTPFRSRPIATRAARWCAGGTSTTDHARRNSPRGQVMDPNGPQTSGILEAQLASELSVLLDGVSVGSEFDVAPSSGVCSSLELFVPTQLRRRYPAWASESLDGVFIVRARKSGPAAAELVGACILMSDQTVTPLVVELALSSSGAAVESYRVRLGEAGGGRLRISGPSCNSRKGVEMRITVADRVEDIAWEYHVASDEH